MNNEQFINDCEEIRDHLFPDYNSMPTKHDINDLYLLKKDHHGHIKFHTPTKKYNIKVGDIVSNGVVLAEVIDIDNEMVCVQTSGGEIMVWETDEIKRVNQKGIK